jgi:transposase
VAQLARTAARRKIAELEQALEGAEFFTAGQAGLLAVMLERIDRVTAGITRLSEVTGQLLAPYEEQLQQAEPVPGWRRRSAQDAIAGTGVDMTRFPAGAHLASWGSRAPLDHQPGTRKGRARSKKGNRYLAGVLGETAVAAGRAPTRQGARYRRLARRLGKPKAQVAAGSTQLKVPHKLLSSPGTRHEDLGADYYQRRASLRRQIRHHVTQLESPGFDVTLCPPAPSLAPPARHTPSDAYRPRRPGPPHRPGSAAARPAQDPFPGQRTLRR